MYIDVLALYYENFQFDENKLREYMESKNIDKDMINKFLKSLNRVTELNN